MLYYEVKDVVREHLARTTFPTDILDKALANGRRIVEQAGNWYWMRQDAYFTLVVDQSIYPINTSGQPSDPVEVLGFSPDLAASNPTVTSDTLKLPTKLLVQPISVPNFKDVRSALVKKQTDTNWNPVETGGITKEEADLHFAINDSGTTELILIDNFNLLVYPPFPDSDYIVHLYYFGWTDNPKSNLQTDELVSHFPEALIFSSLVWAYEIELKDMQGASYWRTLLGGKPNEIGYGGEIAKIRRHNLKRMRQDNMSLVPMNGPNERSRRLRLTQNIWLGSYGWR
jgi:hypothetical protein